jgi:hypothetical protein
MRVVVNGNNPLCERAVEQRCGWLIHGFDGGMIRSIKTSSKSAGLFRPKTRRSQKLLTRFWAN